MCETATFERLPQAGRNLPDFFALAGIWEGRNISAESLRKTAWPERTEAALKMAGHDPDGNSNS